MKGIPRWRCGLLVLFVWTFCRNFDCRAQLPDRLLAQEQWVALFSSPDPAVRARTYQAVEESRTRLVAGLEQLIGRYRNRGDVASTRITTESMFLYSHFAARRSVPTLVDNLGFSGARAGSGAYFTMPQVLDLVRVGGPAVPPLVDRVTGSDDRIIAERTALVLQQMLGEDFARLLVARRLEHQTGERERRRLIGLRDAVVAQHRWAPRVVSGMDPVPIVPHLDATETAPAKPPSPKTKTCAVVPMLQSTSWAAASSAGALATTRLDLSRLIPDVDEMLKKLESADGQESQAAASTLLVQRSMVVRMMGRVINENARDRRKAAIAGEAMRGLARADMDGFHVEAVAFVLVEHLGFTLPARGAASGQRVDEFDCIPQIQALIAIGLPCLDLLAKKVAATEDQATLHRAGIAIDEILGTEFAVLYVQDRISRESDETKKKRLVQLEQEIDKVERVRKVKYQRSPLEVAILGEPEVGRGK